MKRFAAVLLLAIAVVTGAQAQPAHRPDFTVAPDGNDSAVGTREKPFATLARARDAVRVLRQAGSRSDIVVEVRGGTYRLTEPIVFTPEDGAPTGARTIYRAASGESPVFSGGREIAGWQPADGRLWRARVEPGTEFEQLFVNGRRATRARSPNKFAYYVKGKPPRRLDPKTGKAIPWEKRAFIARTTDIANLAALAPEDLARVTVQMYHSWSISRHHVKSVEPAISLVELAAGSRYPINRWGASERYHIENVRAALDAPGEWFLARDGEVLYYPLPDEDMATARVVAPAAKELVRFDGDPKAGRYVERVTLDGLSFLYARHREPPRGRGSHQAASTIPAAVTLNGVREIEIDRCEVGHVGAHGIWFETGCTSSSITHTYVHDTGAGGVRIGEASWGRRPVGPLQTNGITLDNSILRDGGHIWTGAVGVLIGHSGHNRVTHNEIADYRYTGVSVGWMWNYRASLAVENLIADNHIHHIGWGDLSDMGGIYTLGVSTGTAIRGNVIHDVYSYDYYGAGGWGIYNDQGSTGIVMENNLVYNTKTGGYHLHFGKDLTLRNNIFAFAMKGQLRRSRIEKHHALTVENNIVYWDGGPMLLGNWLDDHVDLHDNIYWDASTTNPLIVKEMRFDEWMAAGRDTGSVLADPLFVDPARRDFRLRERSPAIAKGFQPFDFSKAGVYGDAAWIAKAHEVEYPEVEFAPEPPEPPPLELDEGFEGLVLGANPPDAPYVNVEHKGDSIGVTDETAASGTQSLKIVDAPDLRASYNPHFFYKPARKTGLIRVAFDMKMEEDAEAWIAWREYPPGRKYLRGPQLWVRGNRVSVGNGTLTTAPLGEWVHYEMTCRLAPEEGKGTWRLEVRAPGREPEVFDNLPIPASEWREFDWLGFISIGTKKAVWYLDNVRLTGKME